MIFIGIGIGTGTGAGIGVWARAPAAAPGRSASAPPRSAAATARTGCPPLPACGTAPLRKGGRSTGNLGKESRIAGEIRPLRGDARRCAEAAGRRPHLPPPPPPRALCAPSASKQRGSLGNSMTCDSSSGMAMCQALKVLPKYLMSSDGILGCGWLSEIPSNSACTTLTRQPAWRPWYSRESREIIGLASDTWRDRGLSAGGVGERGGGGGGRTAGGLAAAPRLLRLLQRRPDDGENQHPQVVRHLRRAVGSHQVPPGPTRAAQAAAAAGAQPCQPSPSLPRGKTRAPATRGRRFPEAAA